MARKSTGKIKLPHMAQNGNKWFAYLRIPTDVQDVFGGHTVMKYSPGHDDPILAYREAKPVIEGWQRKIALVRGREDASALLQASGRQFYGQLDYERPNTVQFPHADHQ